MEVLELLERKVRLLCEQHALANKRVLELQEQLSCLEEENKKLRAQIETFEEKFLLENRAIEEMGQERELTRLFVDDLIQKVDSFVGSSHETREG